jgi:biopolymer transport protein ExbD
MNYLLEVCLAAVTVATVISPSAVAQPASRADQPLQKGISVELPVTSNAIPMPDADQEGALVVSVTDDGRMYFGVDPVSPTVLAEKVRDGLSHQQDKKLYIKADARTSYSNLVRVLDAVRGAGISALTLLTSQRDSSESGSLVPPRGMEVSVESPSLDPGAIVVQVLNSGQRWPMLKVNGEPASRADLQSTLTRSLQNQSKSVVLVKAEAVLRYADVVDVVDICHSAGARTILVTPRQ